MTDQNRTVDISIILPCLNEEKSIGACLDKIKAVIAKYSLDAEIIVVDNNSNDNTATIVLRYIQNTPNLYLLEEKQQGYGSAYIAGLKSAAGNYIFMADADCTYDFNDIPRFIDKLKKGYDLVVGNRFNRTLAPRTMPFLHRSIGNPLLSLLVKTFFNVHINDIHCGERALSRTAYNTLKLHAVGMEFASEMIIKAARRNLRITELDVSYGKRVGESKLRSFRDGWRHVRLILLYSPLYLFIIPGVAFLTIGMLAMILGYISPPLWGAEMELHSMFLAIISIVVGYQLILFGGFAKIYALTHLDDDNPLFEKFFAYITIEKAGTIGVLLTLLGAALCVYFVITWIRVGHGSLRDIQNSILALLCIIVGIQTIFSSFMFSILGIREKP